MNDRPPRPAFGQRDTGPIPEARFTPTPRFSDRSRIEDWNQQPFPKGFAPLLLLVGPNHSGKTLWARWAADRATAPELMLAALDTGERALGRFFNGVAAPPEGASVEACARYLYDLISYALNPDESDESLPVICDMGGLGEPILRMAADSGIIARPRFLVLLFLPPRQQDLRLLVDLLDCGYPPDRLCLMLSDFLVEPGTPFDTAYDGVLSHSVLMDTVHRGARVIRLPRLQPQALAQEIELKSLGFSHAAAGTVPAGSGVTPIRGFDRSRVSQWLARMNEAHSLLTKVLP